MGGHEYMTEQRNTEIWQCMFYDSIHKKIQSRKNISLFRNILPGIKTEMVMLNVKKRKMFLIGKDIWGDFGNGYFFISNWKLAIDFLIKKFIKSDI